MEIILDKISRRFNREWIFKNIDYTFKSGESYAILGLNGSGKSTLLQILSGSLSPSTGTIVYSKNGNKLEVEQVFQELSIAAPYLELIEEFSLTETIAFHFNFKKRLNNISNEKIIDILNMYSSRNKEIKYFSSGMKQRVKLALSFFSDTSILLLDEPTSNLDEQGINWYHQLVKEYHAQRMIIVCSNQAVEYNFCTHHLPITNYKNNPNNKI